VHDQIADQPEFAPQLQQLEQRHAVLFRGQRAANEQLVAALRQGDPARLAAAQAQLQSAQAAIRELRTDANDFFKQAAPLAEAKDTDYVFLTFVLQYLPRGLVGLLIAVVLSAAMASAAAGLNALASTTVIDLYKPARPAANEQHYVSVSRWATITWGVLGIGFALFAARLENLIQAVNILGSLFYGTILGIFVVAFFMKRIESRAVFWAAVITQGIIFLLFFTTNIAYLWYNIIGCALVMLLAAVWQKTGQRVASPSSPLP
jgi:Na+/proline symporter